MSVDIVRIPECSSHVTVSEYDIDKANSFDPRYWSYYQDIAPSWIAGAVLCGIALLGASVFTTWLLTLCCRQHYWKWELEPLPGTWTGPTPPPRRKNCGPFHTFLMFLFLVATVGLCIWGLVESILASESTISSFWGVVVGTQNKVANITDAGMAAVDSLETVRSSMPLLLGAGDTVSIQQSPPPLVPIGTDLVGSGEVNIQSVDAVPSNVSDLVRSMQPVVAQAISDAQQALQKINETGVQGIQDLRNDAQNESDAFENTWRLVAFSVLFGLVMLLALLSTLLALNKKTPRAAAFFCVFFWLVTALLLGLGAGIFAGGFQVSMDGCLYGEAFVVRVVREKVKNPEPVLFGLQYYFGNVSLAESEVAEKIYGLNISSMLLAASSLSPISQYLQSDNGQAFIEQFPPGADKKLLQEFPAAVVSVDSNTRQVDAMIRKGSFDALYDQAKTFVCCDLSDTLDMVWISWTAAGCSALVLATLVSIRIVTLVVFK